MVRYEVVTIERPASWKHGSLDDVPPTPSRMGEVLGQSEEFFAAVRQAMAHNERAAETPAESWAVVVEPGSAGLAWRRARLCTPVEYKVAAIWWPTGWEPQSPLDVPNCVWRAEGETEHSRLTYAQAVAVVRGLNQQSQNVQATLWYVIVAVENEPLSQSVSYDPAGTETTVQVRRLHVVRPEEGGRGDCTYCPAQASTAPRQRGWTLPSRSPRNSCAPWTPADRRPALPYLAPRHSSSSFSTWRRSNFLGGS